MPPIQFIQLACINALGKRGIRWDIAVLRAQRSLHPTAGAPAASRAQVAELDISERWWRSE